MTKGQLEKKTFQQLHQRKARLEKTLANEVTDEQLQRLAKEIARVEDIIDFKEREIVASLNYQKIR